MPSISCHLSRQTLWSTLEVTQRRVSTFFLSFLWYISMPGDAKEESTVGSQSGKDHGDKCANRAMNFQVTFLGCSSWFFNGKCANIQFRGYFWFTSAIILHRYLKWPKQEFEEAWFFCRGVLLGFVSYYLIAVMHIVQQCISMFLPAMPSCKNSDFIV